MDEEEQKIDSFFNKVIKGLDDSETFKDFIIKTVDSLRSNIAIFESDIDNEINGENAEVKFLTNVINELDTATPTKLNIEENTKAPTKGNLKFTNNNNNSNNKKMDERTIAFIIGGVILFLYLLIGCIYAFRYFTYRKRSKSNKRRKISKYQKRRKTRKLSKLINKYILLK